MSRKKLYISILLTVIFAVFALSAAACSGGKKPEPSVSPTVSPTAEPSKAPTPTPTPTPSPTPSPTQEPMPSAEPTPSELPDSGEEEPDAQDAEPETSEPPELKPEPLGLGESAAVSDDFFSDAAFFGNSLVDGLRMFGGLEHGDFHAATSASVINVTLTKNKKLSTGEECTLFQALTEKQYGKIYILLGINEIGFDPDYFIQLYSTLLDNIAEAEPEAELYIMSLTPVTRETSDSSGLFTASRIREYNEALYALAEERGCGFLDLCCALSDAFGYLPEEESTDGIHLASGKYTEWADFLRTHY